MDYVNIFFYICFFNYLFIFSIFNNNLDGSAGVNLCKPCSKECVLCNGPGYNKCQKCATNYFYYN